MKYLTQIAWILLFSLAGELLHSWLPFPIPASIYGLLLLLLALSTKLVKLEQIKESGSFLVSIMAVMFVCPAVGLLKYWNLIQGQLFGVILIIVVSFLLTFLVSGHVTQYLICREEKKHE